MSESPASLSDKFPGVDEGRPPSATAVSSGSDDITPQVPENGHQSTLPTPGSASNAPPPARPGGPLLPGLLGPPGSGLLSPPGPGPMPGNMPPSMGPPFQGPPPGSRMMMAPPPRMMLNKGMMIPPGGPMSVGVPTPPMGSVMMRPPNMAPAPAPGGSGPGPIVDKNGEMWLEHRAPDGRVYYGNVRTRETRWTQPDLADLKQAPPPVPALAGGLHGPRPGAMPMMPPGGPPMAMGGPPMAMGGPPMMGPPPGAMPMPMPPMAGGPMMPPGGPPHMGMMSGPPPMMVRPPFPGHAPMAAPVLARVWSEHKHPDGRTYYYNRLTMKSEWKRPSDFDSAMAPSTQVPVPPAAAKSEKEADNQKAPEGDGNSKSDGEGKATGDEEHEDGDKEEKMEVEEKEKEEPSDEPTRPIATKPVPGRAPWVIVFTSDDRVFFFNQTSSQSVWSVPEELADVENIEELMKTPHQRAEEEAAKRQADRESESLKRPSEDSEEPPAKKPAVDTAAVLDPDQDGLTTEQRAQRLRATLSLEERQQEFKALLAEKKVSAFSTWERELNKLVFDPRYLLLSAKERKATFDQYLRTRAEDERKEKKDQHKGKRTEFKVLLEEAQVAAKSLSFSDFAMRFGRDKRFKAVEKMKEREAIYNEYTDEERQLLRKKKNEERSAVLSVEDDFVAMLKEDKSLTARSHWKKVKDDFNHDERYHAVQTSERREELFKKYRQGLIEEKQSSERREHEREERVAASLKERKRQVELARSEQQREVEIGRSHHIKEEAEQALRALLADMVRDSELDWSAACSLLRKDHRWNSLDALSSDKKEKIFEAHCSDLRSRKRTFYSRLLNEIPGLTLGTTWKEVKKVIKSDSKYEKLANDPRRKEEFQRFMNDRVSSARQAYRQLLSETRLLTHKSRDLWDSGDSHRKEVMAILEKDNRHMVMESVSEERESLLRAQLSDLVRRGPPPPPTASDSSTRYTRRYAR